MLQEESHFIAIEQGKLHLKRIFKDHHGPAVFLMHGSMENGKIFYSNSLKGYAPYLAAHGYDVYIADSLGRGKSTPLPHRKVKYNQTDIILKEIPAFISKIREIRGEKVLIHAGAHSWGGVLLLAYLARFQEENFQSMVFFGTKRSIKVKSWRKFIGVDVIWSVLGEIATSIKGYFPAKDLKLGSDNEFAQVYRDCRNWVYDLHEWKDKIDQFDYMQGFSKRKELPPTLYLAGLKDYFLGNPVDVKRLMKEVNHAGDKYVLLAQSEGFQKDYGHIDMCIDPKAQEDHFPITLAWLKENELEKVI